MTGRAIGNRLAIAQAHADAARARLSGTIGQLQQRTRPASLVQDVTETLKERGADLVVGLVDTAKSRPAHTGAVLALAGLFLARHHVARWIRHATAGTTPRSPSTPKRGAIT